jgi:hypothetical protein
MMNKNKLKREIYKAIRSDKDWHIIRSRWSDNKLHIGLCRNDQRDAIGALQDRYGMGKRFDKVINKYWSDKTNVLRKLIKPQVSGIKRITQKDFWGGHACLSFGIEITF